MVKRLRLKCVYIGTAICFIVLAVLIGSITVAINIKTDKTTDRILNILVANDGKMPIIAKGDEETDEYYKKHGLYAEAPFETRYFTVTLGDDGNVTEVNLERIFAVREEEATDFALRAYLEEQDEGQYGCYKFTSTDVVGGKMYIFLDCTKYLTIVRSFKLISLSITLIVLFIVFVFVALFSSIIIRPFAESYDKQRQFITNANHEIKTPLAIISATNEVMEMEYGESEWTETIKSQLERLDVLTEKLVFLSRIEEQAERYVMSEFSLSDTALEVSTPYSIIATAEKKEFIVDVAPDVNVVGECSLIGKMLTMLLDNSFKYSPPNGVVELVVEQCGKGARIVIKNTAENVKKGKLDNIFERFYRADASHNSEISGHGIGLSIVKTIVNLHKGKVTARSEDGNSVTITVTI